MLVGEQIRALIPPFTYRTRCYLRNAMKPRVNNAGKASRCDDSNLELIHQPVTITTDLLPAAHVSFPEGYQIPPLLPMSA
jgi:hypothetical protein